VRSNQDPRLRSAIAIGTLCAPLVFFAAPMGMGSYISQPLAGVILLPWLFVARRKLLFPLLFLALIAAVSAHQALSSAEREFSIFQFVRAGAPFFFGCAILAGYNDIYVFFGKHVDRLRANSIDLFDKVMLFFAAGQLIQITGSFLGVNIANAMFGSADSSGAGGIGRISLFPHAAAQLIFFYACLQQRLLLMAISAFVLLASGSKAVIITVIGLFALASTQRRDLKAALLNLCAIALLAGVIFYANPTAIERLSSFVSENQMEDATREWETYYAKDAFFSGADTVIFGNGLAKPLTPGIASVDPRWSENSKYDIENGYWGLLATVGVLGTTLYLCMFLALPTNTTFMAILLIEVVTAFASRGLFFTRFEAPYLFAWSIVINYLLAHARSGVVAGARRPVSAENLVRAPRRT